VRLALQVQYAICGVFDLAYNGQGEPVRMREIGVRQGIPARYLEQIFQRLRRSGIVTSKRGPGGGYLLARSANEITLRHVVEAVEGPLAEGLAGGAPGREAPTPFRPDFLWPALGQRLADLLDATTLEGLCRDASRASVERVGAAPPMYFI